MIAFLVTVAILAGLGVYDHTTLRQMDEEQWVLEEAYWYEVWDEDDTPHHGRLSFDAWLRERDAPRLPPAKDPAFGSYR